MGQFIIPQFHLISITKNFGSKTILDRAQPVGDNNLQH